MKRKNNVTKDFNKMMSDFGEAMAEIFRDPKLKDDTQAMTKSIAKSAKTFGARFEDQKVKDKFSTFGKSTSKLGRSISKKL